MFGELTENLTRRRNDQLLEKVRSLATVTCAYPGPVASCAFSRTVARSPFILQLADASVVGLLTLLLKLPGQTITKLFGVIIISSGLSALQYTQKYEPNKMLHELKMSSLHHPVCSMVPLV